MERRGFLKGTSAAGLLALLDPAYVRAREAFQAGSPPSQLVPKRPYGRAKDSISMIGFGGIIVMDVTPEQASRYVGEAVDRGVNYFDVAPSYGNAQERLGPALKPHRDGCFLACKTTEREAAGARGELEESLRVLQTDRLDLYQLHALTSLEDVDRAFAPGGAMEVFLKARERGQVRYLGFSAHSEEAAHAAMDRHDFDSILFPLGFPTWIKEGFGPSVHKRAQEGGKAILALKAMAHRKWTVQPEDRKWNKTWYEPFDQLDQVSLGLRFTNDLPVHAMIPPGHWDLFKMAVELAQAGALTPLNDAEREIVAAIAQDGEPIFEKKA
ncbi:aldo/keto reductase [Planctomyces sp. SH-PL62]|uniref:aldo/keto reductase n=1 Tax=Planctomyces sp. SH-PL62 TaxID=1636152 RepID=UPI00078C8D36|nr:aldo/keto reductase [Planctomyces sp. SH-PL62]AMV38496.1 General stress protein 69 [Planctomyces sp. SH-PL62]